MTYYQDYVKIGLCGLEFKDDAGKEHACYLQTGHDGKKHFCDCGAELNDVEQQKNQHNE